MKTIRQLSLMSCLAVLLGLGVGRSYAEDIDLFVGTPPANAQVPNVLIIFDNTANWNQPFANEKSALRTLFQNMPVNPDNTAKLNIGLMLFTETGTPNNNTDGGYVRAALRPMTPANKTVYANLINSLDQSADVSNGGKAGLTMAEAYRYLSAGQPRSGNNKTKTDFTGNDASNWKNPTFTTASKAASLAVYGLSGNALASVGSNQYLVPGGGGCRKNYIIYISNSAAQDNNSDIVTGEGMLTAAGGSTSRISISPSGSAENPSDEWARFMKQSPLDVTTYTIDVNRVTTGQGPGWSALLKSMAGVSQGKYFPVTVDASVGASEFANALNQALAEILAVNTVFASVSLPVSVNTQGTYLNQVFIGMFRPDAAAAPRWNGNLKQYRMGLSGSALQLQDANGNSAINGQTGFIGECARSYWTPTTRDTYWTFKPQGLCPIPADQTDPNYYAVSNSPDGSVVEKGGQGYVLRSSTNRNVKTCSKTFASCTALTNFEVGNADIDHTTLGVGNGTPRDDLIRWSRGLDVLDEDIDGVTTAETRPSVHGDVVHSRPVAINLGTDAAPKVTVFYGGNDGVFRAVNGNRVTTVSSATQGNVAPGGEYWSFIPPESFPILKRLQANAPMIKFPNVTDVSAKVKDYGMDGAITAHQFSTGAWIYSTMRRGGRVLYAFNVNNTDPGNVTLKWKVGCPKNLVPGSAADDTGCTSGFSGIGQTWSAPKVFVTENAPTTPLLLIGGGHDLCEDADPNTCSATSKGRKVYVLDADTGALLNTFDTERPVVAEVTLVPDLTTNYVKYAYVVDMGGNVYRVNIGADAPAAWTMTQIAALGCSTPATCTGNRKFQFGADVIAEGAGYALLVGSGDREKPLIYGSPSVVNSVDNYFFKIQDKPLEANWLSDETANCGGSYPFLCLASLHGITGATAPTVDQLAAKKGWYLALGAKEQVVTSAITIFGTVTFSTYEPHVPDPTSCVNGLGIARVYNVDVNNATSLNGTASRFEQLPAGGLPPSPVAGMVNLDGNPNAEPAGNGPQVAFCIGCSGSSPLEAEEPPVPVLGLPTIPKSRVYWYIEK